MKGVKGASFGVRFYRRAGVKTSARETMRADVANMIEDIDALERAMTQDGRMELKTVMTVIPQKTATFVMSGFSAAEGGRGQGSIRVQRPVLKASPLNKETVQSPKEQTLWDAAKAGDCARIRVLVMQGADLDARDALGRTAINIATQYNRQDALKTLLAAREMRRMAKAGELPQGTFYKKFGKVA